MAGKHRKISRPAAVVAAVVAPGGIAAAALAVSGFSPGVVASPAEPAPPSAVDLLALITPANSTAQIFAGTTYYRKDYANPPIYGPQQTVPFFQGPDGIATAIQDADTGQKERDIVVLASGWGAGQTGTALGDLAGNPGTGDDDPALDNVKLVILDNNTNRAGGGFWTTYAPFAPLLLTDATPTPSNTGVPVLDVAYEYNINSDAPVDPLNPFALGNSLAAYAYGYGAQSTAVIPPGVMAEAQDPTANTDTETVHYHYVLRQDGSQISKTPLPAGTTTTYVTIDSGDLPLTRPLRLIPGGDILADAIDPTMTQLVNAGYNDGKGTTANPAIPKDPTVTRPMQPGSSLTGLGGVPGSVSAGVDAGATTAIEDVSNPTSIVTNPIKEAGKLPIISGLSPSTLTNQSVLPNTLNANSPNFFAPGVLPGTGNKKPSSGSPATGANVATNFTDQVKKAVDKVTGGLTGAKSDNGNTD